MTTPWAVFRERDDTQLTDPMTEAAARAYCGTWDDVYAAPVGDEGWIPRVCQT